MFRIFALLLFLAAPAVVAGDQLPGLMAERLGVAVEVARAKWNRDLPVDAPAREAAILDRAVALATDFNLPPAFVRAFFEAQMEAGKGLQRRLLADWRREGRGPFSTAPDLNQDIRPRLDRLTPDLLAALNARQEPPPTPAEAATTYPAPAGLDPATWRQAWEIALAPLGAKAGTR